MSTALAQLQEQLRQELQAQRGQLPVEDISSTISLKNKRFTLPNGDSNDGPMRCIILDHRWTNSYFKGKYNSADPQPPVCSAKGIDANTLAPVKNAKEPQSDSCSTCSKNEFPESGGGKPCKNGCQIAVTVENPTENSPIFLINMAPTSRLNYVTYVSLVQSLGFLPLQVITTLDFDEKESYVKLTFSNPKPHEDIAIAIALRERAQKLLNK
jgi:hypothetical protein